MNADFRRMLSAMGGREGKLKVAAVGTVATSFIGAGGRFLLQIFFADALGTYNYGRFAGLRAWGEFLSTLPHRGYRGAAVRFLPGYQEHERWSLYRGIYFRSVLGTLARAVVLAILAFGVGLWYLDDPVAAVIVVAITIPGWSMLRILQSMLQAQHQFFWGSLSVNILQPLLLAVGLLFFWLAGFKISLTLTLGLLAGSLVATALIEAWISLRSVPAPVLATTETSQTEATLWKKSSNRQFGAQMAIAVIGMASILVLDVFEDPTQVGLYAIAARIAFVGRMVNSGVESVVSSRIAAAWSRDDLNLVQQTVSNAIRLSTVPTVLIVISVGVFRDFVLGLVGDSYRAAGTVLLILLVGNISNALTGPSGYLVAMTGNEHVHAKIMARTAIGLVVATLLVVGPGGIVAVAVVRSAADVAWNIGLLVFARRELGVRCYPTLDLFRRTTA